MNQEIQSIISSINEVIEGSPWFGRSALSILVGADTKLVYLKPNEASHSMIELLYHMNTWANFTLDRIDNKSINDPKAFEELDWRKMDPVLHQWDQGLAEFRNTHLYIIEALSAKNDAFLEKIVDYRKYNFRYLLNGLIQHDIYHLGQLAYVEKLLK
jgi:uncharacterized damage-inducible protein DinB